MQVINNLLLWLLRHPPCAVVVWYVVISLVTLVFYWSDKRAAQKGEWRTPESSLHFLELLGGWPGALIGQKKLHHKCSKESYQFEFCIMVALNIFGLLYLSYGWITGDWRLDILGTRNCSIV